MADPKPKPAFTPEGRGWFPATHWSRFASLRAGDSAQRHDALNFLLQHYWKPVYCYLRRSGWGEEDAKDLTQEFFAACLRSDLFGQADPARGRFRNFLLVALRRFLANAQRAAHARKRRPPQGFVPLDDLAAGDSASFEPADSRTPEAVFHRAWLADLTQRALRRLEHECQATGKQVHYELFRQRLVLPALEGTEPPPLRDLAARLGLSEKQAANCLLTARRAFRRLLEVEIRDFTMNQSEADAELRDLLHFLGEA
jgi:RNA polymerase sigma-70 factor (ECF subfamily)